MKKITFNANVKEGRNIFSIVKDLSDISCQVQIDFENGIIVAENINDNSIDAVIELVDNNYVVQNINIDNIMDDSVSVNKDMSTAASDTTCKTSENSEIIQPKSVNSADTLNSSGGSNSYFENQPIVNKTEFPNHPVVENLMNKLSKVVYWAMNKKNASIESIRNSFNSIMSEISMLYSPEETINFSVGDIVDCNFGSNLPGEIMGTHINAVVCNILQSGTVYVAPMLNVREDISTELYIPMNISEDAVFDNLIFDRTTVVLNKARYVNPRRINAVVGKTTDEFFYKIACGLANFGNSFLAIGLDTEDYSKSVTQTDDESTIISENNDINEETSKNDFSETMSENDNTATLPNKDENETISTNNATMVMSNIEDDEKICENDSSDLKSTVKENQVVLDTSSNQQISSSNKKCTVNASSSESVLLMMFKNTFLNIESGKTIEDQVEFFLSSIGMPTNGDLLTSAFVVACDIDKVTYENVVQELHKIYPSMKPTIIKAILKDHFKNWLTKYPKLAETCPKISIMSLIKVFVKNFF